MLPLWILRLCENDAVHAVQSGGVRHEELYQVHFVCITELRVFDLCPDKVLQLLQSLLHTLVVHCLMYDATFVD